MLICRCFLVRTDGYKWVDSALGAGGGQGRANSGFIINSPRTGHLWAPHHASVCAWAGRPCWTNSATGHALYGPWWQFTSKTRCGARDKSIFTTRTCVLLHWSIRKLWNFLSTEDRIAFADELSSAPHGLVAPPDSAEELLASVKLLMSENLVRQVGASYHFDINSEDRGHRRYYVDLSQGNWIIIPIHATLNTMKDVSFKNQTCI